ncbi:hypothetical protein EH165_12470 [Nakamurella antarctica]|uniref:Toxin YqcG C-terminal domain-containing protein n=1 Tax=Nakamurella antarctica TaxID=1902245 RepID=A0A3G8ZNK0_9ACTN|nr:GH-E family nuclease [Nakamurella antarctica]AZI58830.1 hypothetical protein EH165_12470 [Nakamurella antarctica]
MNSVHWLGTQLQDLGADASAAAVLLQKLSDGASDAVWRGDSADAFRARILELPVHLDQLGSSYQVAGDGFVTYAAVVADIAVRAEGFRAAGASADRDKSRAVSAQGAWVDPVVAVNAAVVANAAAGGVLVAPVPVVAGVNPHDEAVRVAAARLQAATDSLHELGGERRSADDRVQGSLEAAHQVGMQNRSAWSHFWEDLSSVLAVITIVLLVVAVVVLFVVAGPAAWAAAGAASGFVASAAAGAAAAGAAMAGVGTAMTVVGAAALGVHSVQAVRGEASWADVGVEALWQLGPGVALKGLKYFGDAARGLKAGAAAEDAAAGIKNVKNAVPTPAGPMKPPTAPKPSSTSGPKPTNAPKPPAGPNPPSSPNPPAAPKPNVDSPAAPNPKTPRIKQTYEAVRNRVTLRVQTERDIYANARRNSDGDFICASSNDIIPAQVNAKGERIRFDPKTGKPDPNGITFPQKGKFDFGHRPDHEWRKYQDEAAAGGYDRARVIEDQNNPEIYQLETPSSNRSHAGETP